MTKLLLIEDNPIDARLIELFLRACAAPNFEFAVADSWEAGRELIHAWEPHLIMLDLVLPNGQGIDLVRAVLAEAKGIPVIVVSAREDDPTFYDCAEFGIEDFLCKSSFDRTRVSRAIWLALRRARGRNPAVYNEACGRIEEIKQWARKALVGT